MSRQWRVALAQASPLQGDDPVAELAADLAAILAERPDTQMVVFPEIHLLGASDGSVLKERGPTPKGEAGGSLKTK